MAKAEIKVGIDLSTVASEVAEAWKAAAAGSPVEPTNGVYFRDWDALCAVLTPKRYTLLRHLRRSPSEGVRAFARALHRDVKRVHEDVVALADLGLIERGDDGSLSSPVDTINATIRIAA